MEKSRISGLPFAAALTAKPVSLIPKKGFGKMLLGFTVLCGAGALGVFQKELSNTTLIIGTLVLIALLVCFSIIQRRST